MGSGVNSLTRRFDVDVVSLAGAAAVAVLMFGSCSRWEAGPDFRTRRRNGEGQRTISALLALKECWMRIS
ncbi:hypothetical protein GCM10007170_04700 [Arthrobacter liuii]|uniref:Uncharacterized protein n=1 Tax=Arthrobacter liuii TaxID=1476996 RepID=A0ABQ2AGW4_9MICC|nr:hypothetical protein GCM10007170_04700 [Arthrobacter liuii]